MAHTIWLTITPVREPLMVHAQSSTTISDWDLSYNWNRSLFQPYLCWFPNNAFRVPYLLIPCNRMWRYYEMHNNRKYRIYLRVLSSWFQTKISLKNMMTTIPYGFVTKHSGFIIAWIWLPFIWDTSFPRPITLNATFPTFRLIPFDYLIMFLNYSSWYASILWYLTVTFSRSMSNDNNSCKNLLPVILAEYGFYEYDSKSDKWNFERSSNTENFNRNWI